MQIPPELSTAPRAVRDELTLRVFLKEHRAQIVAAIVVCLTLAVAWLLAGV
jgi:hypothetical protein